MPPLIFQLYVFLMKEKQASIFLFIRTFYVDFYHRKVELKLTFHRAKFLVSTNQEYDHDLRHLKFQALNTQLFQQNSKPNHAFQYELLNQNQKEEDIHLFQKEYFPVSNLCI